MANPNGNDALAKSVTADDYNTRAGSSVFHFMLPAGGSASPDLPGFWSFNRDYVLYSTLYRESMWAAAIGLAITKLASKDLKFKSDIPIRVKKAQELFLSFDSNKGWVGGLTKHLLAYFLTGNGGHVEIVRATSAAGSKILGLIPLDPFRCIRTGDPDIPVLYRDRLGKLHEMKDYQVFSISDMPDASDLWYGVGHCAGERAYGQIIKQESIERYVYDKVSGKRALSFYLVNGVLPGQIDEAKKSAVAESIAKGVVNYLGAVIIPMAGDVAPSMVEIPLAALPDGFNRKEETDHTILVYARSIGIAVQDLQPLSGQGLGTGVQTVVLDESAKGMGSASWIKQFEHNQNMHVLDDRTTFYFSTFDLRDKEREAKVSMDVATGVKTWVDMGAINSDQARQMGVDHDQLPKEFLEVDATPETELSDDEKPMDESEVAPIPVTPEVPTPLMEVAQKIYRDVTELAAPATVEELRAVQGEIAKLKAVQAVVPERVVEVVREDDRRVVPAPLDANAIAIQVAALASALVDKQKAASEVMAQEILAHDAQGLTLRVRKVMADGSLQEYEVERDATTRRIARLVRL